eukprot:895798-Pelagomonas_calceolata.AAC.3
MTAGFRVCCVDLRMRHKECGTGQVGPTCLQRGAPLGFKNRVGLPGFQPGVGSGGSSVHSTRLRKHSSRELHHVGHSGPLTLASPNESEHLHLPVPTQPPYTTGRATAP